MMNKYHCYEVGSENYICTLYTYTDVLNLQLFLKEKGFDLILKPVKMDKKQVKRVFGKEGQRKATLCLTKSVPVL